MRLLGKLGLKFAQKSGPLISAQPRPILNLLDKYPKTGFYAEAVHAGLAQLVERLLAMQKVVSSSLISRSIFFHHSS